jgi:cardiolipin synthase
VKTTSSCVAPSVVSLEDKHREGVRRAGDGLPLGARVATLRPMGIRLPPVEPGKQRHAAPPAGGLTGASTREVGVVAPTSAPGPSVVPALITTTVSASGQLQPVPLPRLAAPDLIPVSSTSTGATALSVRLTGTAQARFGGPMLEATLDATTRSIARPGNTTKVLFDGVTSFPERHRLIDAATSTVHLQTFIFNDDAAGWELAQRLALAAKRGVDVRVIVDKLGSNRAKAEIFDFMRAAGVDLKFYDTGLNPLTINNRWHEKHLIVDGRVSIQGGMNISDEYALGGSGRAVIKKYSQGMEAWRDTDVKIEGPAVADTQRAFVANWTRLGGAIPAQKMAALFPRPIHAPSGVKVRVVQHHPTEGHDHTMALYTAAIGAATKTIRIENAYFVPPPELRAALIDAAKRGVDVQIMTNSKESSDMGFVVDAARYWYDELLAAGVKVFEVSGGTLHAKTASFDGAYSLIGSANLNGRSKSLDGEVVLAIDDATTAKQLDDRFASGLARARPVTAAELQQDSFVTNLKQWAFSTLSWTF